MKELTWALYIFLSIWRCARGSDVQQAPLVLPSKDSWNHPAQREVWFCHLVADAVGVVVVLILFLMLTLLVFAAMASDKQLLFDFLVLRSWMHSRCCEGTWKNTWCPSCHNCWPSCAAIVRQERNVLGFSLSFSVAIKSYPFDIHDTWCYVSGSKWLQPSSTQNTARNQFGDLAKVRWRWSRHSGALTETTAPTACHWILLPTGGSVDLQFEAQSAEGIGFATFGHFGTMFRLALGLGMVVAVFSSCAPNQCITLNGYKYRTLDGVYPHVTQRNAQVGYLPLLDGWELCMGQADCLTVASSHGWGCARIVMQDVNNRTSDQHCICTSNYKSWGTDCGPGEETCLDAVWPNISCCLSCMVFRVFSFVVW